MTSFRIVMLGGPDSGKTNFFVRLWSALDAGDGTLSAKATPDDIKYVEDALAHLHSGEFAPRTDTSLQGSLTISLETAADHGGLSGDLTIPDMSGEVWQMAADNGELPDQWMDALESATGAMLFVRAHSPLNIMPLDWVNSEALMRLHGAGEDTETLPTQVLLCELVRFLEEKIGFRSDGARPRLAVIITAWDLLDAEEARAGPQAYIASQYPLLAGRLRDLDRFDVALFGVSIVGGDLNDDPNFRTEFFKEKFDETGWIMLDTADGVRKLSDLTLPVAWAVGATIAPA